MSCFYEKNDKKYTSELELVEDFFKDNFQLKEGSIYSAEDVQESSLNVIRNISADAEYDADEGKYLVSSEPDKKAKYMTIQELTTQEHPGIFNQIQEIKGDNRLSPEYIEEKRILNHIIKRIDDLHEVPQEFLDRIDKAVKTNTPFPYSTRRFETLKGLDELKGKDHKKIQYLLSNVQEEIRMESHTAKFSKHMYEFIELALSGKSYDDEFEEFYNNIDNREVIGPNYLDANWKESWRIAIDKIVNNIKDKVENIGVPIVNLKLVAEGHLVGIKGEIKLLAIDAEGNVNIFKIKVSKNSFSNWDSGKLSNADWELAMEKQLLSQHVNVDRIQLYIIPIVLSELENPTKLTVDEFENRSTDTLMHESKISRIADKILPRKFYSKYDETSINEIKEKMNKIVPSYELRTEESDDSVENIMEKATKRFEKEGIWKWYNNFEGVEGVKKGWIEESNKEEFENKIQRYVAYLKTLKNRHTNAIRDGIITAKKTNQAFKTSKIMSDNDQIINRLIQPYLNPEWEVLNSIPESIALGIILFRNVKTGVITVFNLSINQLKSKNKETGLSVGDLEMVKVMLFLNEFKDHFFPNSSYTLGNIITLNPREKDPHYNTSLTILNNFKNIMSKAGLSSEVRISERNILGIEDIALLDLTNALDNYVGKESENLGRIMNVFQDRHVSEIEKENLIKVRNDFLEKYPEYKDFTVKPELNFNDPLEVIFALLQVAILSKEGIEPTGDFRDLSKFSLGHSDFKSLLSSIYSKDVEEYDKTGKKIQGIVGGLAWTTPEWVQSKDLRQINGLISTGNSIIGERMVKFNEKMWILTENFYKEIGYNRGKQLVWGETQSIHEEFFLTDENGNVHRDFKTKNPYISDVKNSLKEPYRRYLQKTLLLINSYKLGIAESVIEKLDPTNLSSLMSNEVIAKAITNEEYFEMPLVRREELSRYKNLFTSTGDSFRKLGALKDDFKDLLDTRELSQYDIANADAQKMGFFEMYDVYGTQKKEIKDKMIDENTVEYYEFNLDTIAHRLAFSKIRKQTFDMILPTVSAYMWWIKLMGKRQNLDITKQLEYIVNQVKLAVFDEPLIGDEQATIAKGIAFAKQISTVAMLAFRPALLMKELTIGTMKNILAAGTGLSEDYGVKEMTQAYEKLIRIDKKFTNEFNMIQKMNHLYRIANMDIATVPSKMQHDRHGAARGFGRWMFTTSTAADYYNRLALMLAKMIKDGSYDAHSMDGNKMVYDVKKDKRFSHYLNEREKHKDKDGNYMPKKGDVKYNDQRNLYLLTIQQLNKEYTVVGRKPLTESDLIEKAYTQRERDSIKAQSDLIYGAYDKDSQAQMPNTLLGITFMQFMTFWPSKMKFWFGKPTAEDGSDSAIGKYEHAYRLDENKNKVYLYWDYVEDENGIPRKEEVTYETDEKMWTWNGTPQEGLFYSVMHTMQDIVTGDWENLKNNKLQRGRTLFALGDAVFIVILLGIIKAMIDAMIAENGRDSVPSELLAFLGTVNNKVLNEHMLWDNTFGAIQTEPVFLAWGKRTANNVLGVVTGDKTLSRALGQSVGAFEILKPINNIDFGGGEG